MEKVFEKTEKYILFALVAILPFTVLSISSNPFVITKLAILVMGLSLYLFVKAVRIIATGKITFNSSLYDLPVLILIVSVIVSTIYRTPNKMEAILLPGTATAMVSAGLVFFALNQIKEKTDITKALMLSAAIYSFVMLLAFLGIFEKIPQLPAFLRSKTYSPEGGYLPSVIFLGSILPLSVGWTLSQKAAQERVKYMVVNVFIVAGVLLSLYQIIPGKPLSPRFPSINFSWNIAVDSLKESPILGVGPGNYLSAFNRYRPISYNQTDLWAVKFATASNFYLHLLTETGLLGIAAVILLITTLYKTTRKDLKEASLVKWGFAAVAPIASLALLLILMAVFPATVLLIVLLFILLSLSAKTNHNTINLAVQRLKDEESGAFSASKVLAYAVSLPMIAAVLYVVYFGGRVLIAEYYFKTSLENLVQNRAQETYDTMRQAITLNPRVDRYRATFSRVSLILADAIARKPEITDTDRTTITQLIQLAISEGKANVALNPRRASNWENLARTYQSIIPLANGADVFAAQSFGQAIALDPLNPNYRISLGGLYYNAQDFDTATRIFELAVSAKPDLPNSHYNLAFAYQQQNKIDAAIQQMSAVLGLVQPNTPDYETAQKALEDLQNKKKEVTAQATDNLTPPQPQEDLLEPKVELPEGTQPPESVITPTPTPEEGAQTTPAARQ